MTGSFWWDLLIGVVAALLLAWLVLVIALIVAQPTSGLLHEALRVSPDVLRLIRRLAADRTLPTGIRIRLGLLLAYLAIPIDIIPDFIPVLGYADDAIIVTFQGVGDAGSAQVVLVGAGAAADLGGHLRGQRQGARRRSRRRRPSCSRSARAPGPPALADRRLILIIAGNRGPS